MVIEGIESNNSVTYESTKPVDRLHDFECQHGQAGGATYHSSCSSVLYRLEMSLKFEGILTLRPFTEGTDQYGQWYNLPKWVS